MSAESASKPPLVSCPKCKQVLEEPLGYDVYCCGGCDTILRANKQSTDVNKESSTQEIDAACSSFAEFSFSGASELVEPPCIGQWHSCVRIELVDNKISELPQSPECPKLKVLMLQGNPDLMDIPDSFFDHMPLLQYLDLSTTSIRELPPSISQLTQLMTLYLRNCDLILELPTKIGQLKKLEELDLDGTLITHLPIEIRELINLQRLILCFDKYHHLLGHGNEIFSSTVIPPGVISNLIRLKYLSISVDPEDDRWNENNVANILEEISGLIWLETVSMHVPEAKLLELIPTRKSLSFNLVVGDHKRRFISRGVTPELERKFKCDYDHCIKFVNGVDVPKGVKMILQSCKALYLDRHMTIKSLVDFELKNLQSLVTCILAECNEMETIVDSRGSYSHVLGSALPRLEFLYLFYMKNLRSICEGPLGMNTTPSFFLCSLRSMALHTCPVLNTIFSISFVGNLSLLEELIVEDCPKVTTLISHESSKHETSIFLPRLRKIWLLYLPELTNIFNGLNAGESLQEMGFYCCPKLQSLSKTELSSPGLRVIKGERRWWETLKWNGAEAGQPNFLKLIFSPINAEADIMGQLPHHHHDVYEDQGQGAAARLNFQDAARRLKLHLQNPFRSEPSLKEHLAIVEKSFTQSISIAPSSDPPGSDADVAHRNLLSSRKYGWPMAVAGNDSGESRKRSQKGGRDCYKRRKSVQTWTKVSHTTDDSHAWRKYGQKEILNSEFPRSYFRCRHKYDQGCRATKQVQRDEEHMYRITYIDIHTCNATSMESPKEDTSSGVMDHDKLDDFNMWSELKDFEPSNKIDMMPLKFEADDDEDRDGACLF